jgi:hypothetical protein
MGSTASSAILTPVEDLGRDFPTAQYRKKPRPLMRLSSLPPQHIAILVFTASAKWRMHHRIQGSTSLNEEGCKVERELDGDEVCFRMPRQISKQVATSCECRRIFSGTEQPNNPPRCP